MLEGLVQNDFHLTVGAIRRRMRPCHGDREVAALQKDPAPTTTMIAGVPTVGKFDEKVLHKRFADGELEIAATKESVSA